MDRRFVMEAFVRAGSDPDPDPDDPEEIHR
jgi:hypothetical protein